MTRTATGGEAAEIAFGGYVTAGLAVVTLLVGGLGVWAATTQISGAVIAPAVVAVETNVKKVQHPTGGVIGEIRVKDGDAVAAGQLLIRLDETVTRANLMVIARQLDQLAARAARLEAARDGASDLTLPAELRGREGEPDLARLIAGERALLSSRREIRDGQKAQLRERISQLSEENAGIVAQIEAKSTEIKLIGKEIGELEILEASDLVTSSRMIALRREQARLDGERAQLAAASAQSRGKITEIELQILRVDQEQRNEDIRELREVQSRQAELSERRIAADDQLKRIEIRAPHAGIVHQLAVHTVGGVVNPSEPIMLIVPRGDRLVLEAKVAPQDIDQLSVDQTAIIRFAAFDQRTTPELVGRVSRIGADLSRDASDGEMHFAVRLEIPDSELARLGSHQLVPGMPADVQIRTEERTALSFLMKPLQDQIARAFRER